MNEIARLLLDDARLVTVVGAGGTGKTRVGLAVADRLLDELSDGAFLIELAETGSTDGVAGTIATALGVRGRLIPRRPRGPARGTVGPQHRDSWLCLRLIWRPGVVREGGTPPCERQGGKMSSTEVGLIGVGLMGYEMGRRLIDSGIAVTAWDRESEHVQQLCEAGGDRADSPRAAVQAGTVAITMLPTADIVLDVLADALEDWPRETVWLQMSSVGASESDTLAAAAVDHGVTQFDAPVSGSTQVARAGKLTVLASGPEEGRDMVMPVLESLGSVRWVGPAGKGSRLKLAVNNWMVGSVTALAETLALCEAMDLDPDHLVSLLDGGPLGSPYGVQKLGEMREGSYPAGFPVRLALKDLQLVEEVAKQAELSLPLLGVLLDRFHAAEAGGHADEDLAAVYETVVSR